MLPLEVLVEKLLLDRLEVWRQLKRHERHVGDAFDRDRALQRLGGASDPM